MIIVNGLQKCGFNLNHTTDSEYAAELNITKVECGQLKAGV